jgi:hypothetical protein
MIDMLPDNVLLEIFDFYRVIDTYYTVTLTPSGIVWRWQSLTKVCRRWRYIILASPRRLDLQLLCSEKSPTKRLLDIWPPFPIVLYCFRWHSDTTLDHESVENLIAALERRNRTSVIFFFGLKGSTLEKLFAVMQESLPVLTYVDVRTEDGSAPVLPETFLGGSAPRLRSFNLRGISFPSLPKFILSVTHIINLQLIDIPHSGYVSPRVMATCLAALPNLESLSVGFRSPLSRPLRINPPPLTRAVLPALAYLRFSGVSEYFEDFVARIDTPLLKQLFVAFFMDLELVFDIPQLHDFVARTETLRPFNQAKMQFSGWGIMVTLGSPTRFELQIECERLDLQLSSLTQIFSQQFPLLSHVEQLEIGGNSLEFMRWKDGPDMDSWLELFQLFVAVQNLYVSKDLVLPVVSVMAALQDLRVTGGTAVEVLPALLNLSLEGLEPSGPVQEAIKSFVTARRLSDHPIAIQRWDR